MSTIEHLSLWDSLESSPHFGTRIGHAVGSASHRGAEAPKVAGSAPDTAWVFPRDDGQPMRREALLDAVEELVTGLGLRKGLRVHDLRHCWARYALHLCAVDVAKVPKALGHASIVITLDLYGSAVEELMD